MPEFSCRVDDDVPPELRLDRYISDHLKILSRSQIKARNLKAILNGKAVKVSRILRGGEKLELAWAEAESHLLVPQNLPIDVIYEDDRVIVVNKAQGMVVHPGAGNRQGTLANALLYRKLNQRNVGKFDVISGVNTRPGIVHRLDKDTSGILIAAWDEEAHAFLSAQFKARKVRKTYAAIVQGCPGESKGCIDKIIYRSRRNRKTFTTLESDRASGIGRRSITYYKVVKSNGKYSLLLLRPKTGRTHQLRVHLKQLGTPVLGDPLYGRADRNFPKATLMLHSKRLCIVLPESKKQVLFNSSLPGRFLELLCRM